MGTVIPGSGCLFPKAGTVILHLDHMCPVLPEAPDLQGSPSPPVRLTRFFNSRVYFITSTHICKKLCAKYIHFGKWLKKQGRALRPAVFTYSCDVSHFHSLLILFLLIHPGEVLDFRAKWKQEGVSIYADFEYAVGKQEERPGLYRMEDPTDEHLGTPFYNWGKFYATIVHSVLVGSWNLQETTNKRRAMNYWFGLSTGVVDIRLKDIPYQTKKLLDFMRKGIISGEFSPFSGEIRARDGWLIQGESLPGVDPNDSLEKMTPVKIITMDWLYENIEGELK